MAHKVLSKDMFELVATMRLALQYSETTLDGEYRKWVSAVARRNDRTFLYRISLFLRNMLSAAHVLAMDAKSLLDVIDSIRCRFPNLFHAPAFEENHSSKSTPNNSATSSPSRKVRQHPLHQVPSPSVEPNRSSDENQYQNIHFPQSSPSIEASHVAENVYANEQETSAGDIRPQVPAKPLNFNVVKVKTSFGNGGTVNELTIVEDDAPIAQ